MIPLWFLLAAVSGASFALEGLWVKHLNGRGFKPGFLAWTAVTFSLPVLWTCVYLEGFPKVSAAFYFPCAMSILGNTAALLFYFRALSFGQLSMVFPLLSLTPAWMLLSTHLITGEFPSTLGLAGIGVSTAGCYALGLDKTGPLSPIRNIWNNPGSRWALLAGLTWSLTANFDKAAVEASSAMLQPAAAGTGLAVTLFGASAGECAAGLRRCATRDGAWRILILTLIVCVLVVSQFIAFDLAQASYVISVKQGGMVLGVLLGWLVYKEPCGLRRLLISCVVLAGLLCLVHA